MYKVFLRIGLIILIGLSATSCTDQKIIEQLGLIQIVGYDLVESDEGEEGLDKIRMTYSMPTVELGVGRQSEVLTTNTRNSSKEGRILLSRRTDRDLVVGQVKSILYNDKLAAAGLKDMFDTLVRDPSIGERVKVNVVQGSAYDILSADFEEYPRIGKYLDLLLEKESRINMIPVTNVYQFYRDMLDDGIDPVTPLIKLGKGEVIADEIALFRDDKYMTKIGSKETLIFSFLRQDYRGGSIVVNMQKVGDEEDIIMFSSLESRKKMKVNGSTPETIEVHIELNVRGNILEYIGDLDLRKAEDQIVLEERIKKYIELKANDMLAHMQSFAVDSIGIGNRVRNSLPFAEWESMDWREVYPKINITVEADVFIKNHGMYY